ncbi:hypothetical protein LA303_00210 [Candidatus Sulfidibacterium hydrothermale]|uniref:hypothetical protein n=1 Tax=Candidatus Sulfidibacterium hydrothermale TaxID=2875962 RepID=UPI001F0A297A|nr:hypothetical protein [Candidatus Sulfidibacterium hydrothermale]UBM62422.1 hypothetical protein LA303_00210 [Candidatus Sulfidibacterium hydrothermale]
MLQKAAREETNPDNLLSIYRRLSFFVKNPVSPLKIIDVEIVLSQLNFPIGIFEQNKAKIIAHIHNAKKPEPA